MICVDLKRKARYIKCSRPPFLPPATLLKMRLGHRCFPVNFAKFLRTPFFTEHVWATVSVHYAHWLGISLKVPNSRGGWSEKVTLAKYHIRLRSACNN